jgi:hypothetical protein
MASSSRILFMSLIRLVLLAGNEEGHQIASFLFAKQAIHWGHCGDWFALFGNI